MRALLLTLTILCLLAGSAQAQYVEDSIDVGGAWVGSLAYNSREDVVYGASETGLFFAISCDSNKLVASHQLSGAFILVYDSLDNKTYASYYRSYGDSLAVIDGATHRVIKRMGMPGATTPMWDPVGDRVYVSCQNSAQVAVVDCRSDSLLRYIDVGPCPLKMYMNTLRRKLYVLNFDAGTVSVIDLATNQVIKTVDVGGTPNSGYYCRRVDKFYCSSPPGSVAVIDGSKDSVTARISLTDHGEALSMTGNELAATVVFGVNSDIGNYAYFVNAPADSVVSVLSIGREPWSMLFSASSGLFYSANAMSDNISAMAGDGSRVEKTLPVGDAPFVLASVPRHQRIYVGHSNCRQVYVIRDTTTAIAEEAAGAEMGQRQTATVVRGVLFLSETASSKPQAASSLLDIGGRKVLDLHPGPNDLSRIPAGVYFVREARAQARAKVIVQR